MAGKKKKPVHTKPTEPENYMDGWGNGKKRWSNADRKEIKIWGMGDWTVEVPAATSAAVGVPAATSAVGVPEEASAGVTELP